MRINEILTEQQLNEMHMLREGPLGSALSAVGRGVGKAVGGVAKGVGAVAGGIAGIGGALKKGFQAGKATVSGDNAGASSTTPAAGAGSGAAAGAGSGAAAGAATPPAAGAGSGAAGGAATPPAAGAGSGAAAGGAATPPAAGAGSGAAAGGAATPPAAGAGGAATPPAVGAGAGAGAAPKAPDASSKADPVYDKAQKAVEALPPEQKKEIIGLLQADPKVKAAMAAKPSTQGKKGVSQPGKPTFTGVPEKPGAAPAVDPAAGAATPPAAGAAKPARTGGKVAGQVSQTPGAIAKRAARADKKKPAGVGLDMNLLKAAQQNASRVNHGNALSEMLARGVAQHKRNMFETQLINGTQSIFRKK